MTQAIAVDGRDDERVHGGDREHQVDAAAAGGT
jgi:hypothetical protein